MDSFSPLGPGWLILFQQVERDPGGRGSDGDINPLIKVLSNAELDALEAKPDLLNRLRIREDDDIIEFIMTTITRGLL